MTRLESLLAVAAGASLELPPPPARSQLPAPPDGPLTALVAVIGESLGAEEDEANQEGKRPCNFIGKSGQKLRRHMQLAGLNPNNCFISNVYPFLPGPGGINSVEAQTIKEWQARIRETLARLPHLQLIVTVGNVALEAFTGFQDITRRRGSVYDWEGKKVLPLVHPAFVLRDPRWEKPSRLDWERAKKLVTPHEDHGWYCGCVKRRERRHSTPFTVGEARLQHTVMTYIGAAQRSQEVLAIDVETPKVDGKRQLICVSFSLSPDESLVLPCTTKWKPQIYELCASPCIKVGHNFVSFDRWWLEREGIQVNGEIRDSLTLSHCLDPASMHSLEFCASRWLWEKWWKDQDHGHDITLIEQNKKEYFDYCGLDSCCTIELHNEILWPMLEARGMREFYRHHYQDLFDPMLDLMLKGVPIDHIARKTLLHHCLKEAREARDKLGVYNGGPLYTLSTKRDKAVYDALVNGWERTITTQYSEEDIEKSLATIATKTVSNTQLKKLLYDTMGLPTQLKRRSTGDITPTADAVTLKKLKQEWAASRPEVGEVIDLALLHNRQMKLASFCYDTRFDDDGRLRFTLKMNTEAARFASSKSPSGTGSNSQNAPRIKLYRRIFLPESGQVLLEVDASQIEGRIVFVRTKDPNLIELARSRTVDQHSFTASLMTGKPQAEVGKGTDERQAAKSANHAAQRGMQGQTMADNMLKMGITHQDGTPYEAEECDTILGLYYKALPGIPMWQQRIRKETRANKRLVNSWGRVWDVRYEEMNDDLCRRAYNYYPQSECLELTNQMGFVPLWYWLKKEKMQSRIMLHEHDALVCSCPWDEVYDVAVFLRDHMEAPHFYDGIELSVPVEYKMGPSWGEGKEWATLPDRETVEAAAKAALAT